MSENEKKRDIRIQKTHTALYNAMLSLLGKQNFNDMTVNNLCMEAYTSRTAFYTYFQDKYDLLSYFLARIRKDIITDTRNYEALEKSVNEFIFSHKKVITNILKDADHETIKIVHECMSSIIDRVCEKEGPDTASPEYTILSNFIGGGLVSHLHWIVENDFPDQSKMLNRYLYKLLETMLVWGAAQEETGNTHQKEGRVVCNENEKVNAILALDTGKGAQYLLDEIYKITRTPVLLHDMEYTLIAHSDTRIEDDPIWVEYVSRGRLSNETIVFFENEGFIDAVASCTNYDGVTYLLSENLPYDRIFGQIYNKNHMPVADLVALDCEGTFDGDTPRLVKAMCDVLSAELGQQEYYQDYGQTYQENIVRKLIDGSIRNKRIYAAHVANIDQGLQENVFLVVADIGQCDPEYAALSPYRDLFVRTQPDFKYYIYAHYIVILVSSIHTAFHKTKGLSKLQTLFEEKKISAGVSSGFDNLFELPRYYREAVHALTSGRKSHQESPFALYDKNLHEPQK